MYVLYVIPLYMVISRYMMHQEAMAQQPQTLPLWVRYQQQPPQAPPPSMAGPGGALADLGAWGLDGVGGGHWHLLVVMAVGSSHSSWKLGLRTAVGPSWCTAKWVKRWLFQFQLLGGCDGVGCVLLAMIDDEGMLGIGFYFLMVMDVNLIKGGFRRTVAP